MINRLKLIAAGSSLKGAKRSRNDDRFLIRRLDERGVLAAVSDGLGGHPWGNMAAEVIIDTLDKAGISSSAGTEDLSAAVYQAESRILEKTCKARHLQGMGATVVVAVVNDRRAVWAHVGDSRLYLVRDHIMRQVTRDHSFLQDLLDAGDIRPAEAAGHPMAHVLDQCVGCMDAGPACGEFAVEPDDILLLCTDGLYRALGDDALVTGAVSATDATRLVDFLLGSARMAGAADDATAVAVSTAAVHV